MRKLSEDQKKQAQMEGAEVLNLFSLNPQKENEEAVKKLVEGLYDDIEVQVNQNLEFKLPEIAVGAKGIANANQGSLTSQTAPNNFEFSVKGAISVGPSDKDERAPRLSASVMSS